MRERKGARAKDRARGRTKRERENEGGRQRETEGEKGRREGRREMLFQVGHEFLGGPVGSSGSWKQVGMGPVVCSGVNKPLFTNLNFSYHSNKGSMV